MSLNGTVVLPDTLAGVRARLSDAGFLAQCVPGATCEFLSRSEARWQKPSPFRFAVGTVHTTLKLMPAADELSFTLDNSVPGGSVQVVGQFHFTESDGGTVVRWTATIASRTGLLKIVPVSVLVQQTETALVEIWEQVHQNWDRLPG